MLRLYRIPNIPINDMSSLLHEGVAMAKAIIEFASDLQNKASVTVRGVLPGGLWAVWAIGP